MAMMTAEFETTPARLQIERDSICQVIVSKKKTSTCLARLEGTAIEVNKKNQSFATILLSPVEVLTASNHDRVHL